MPIWFVSIIVSAFVWLFYESNWMRVRLPVGAIKQPIKTIKLRQVTDHRFMAHGTVKYYGLTHNDYRSWYNKHDGDLLFHAGIEEPVCGWDWLLNHEHPIIENRIEIQAHNCKHSIHLCDNPEVDYGRIMKEVCQVAFKSKIRRNGHKPKKHKGCTFNPNYGMVKCQSQ